MFYVYELIDPRTSKPFYVGKGKGDRSAQHEKEARRGKSGPKCERIREIWSAGLQVKCNIVAKYSDEDDAYIAEALHIDRLGLENLTNLIPGGSGAIAGPFKWTLGNAKPLRATIIRLLGILTASPKKKIHIGPYDVTDATASVIRKLWNDLGDEKFCKLVGVNGQ